MHWRCSFANDLSPRKAEVYRANFGGDDLWVGVPQGVDGEPGEHVEVPRAVLAVEIDAFASVDLQRDALVGVEEDCCLAVENVHRLPFKKSVCSVKFVLA